MGGLVCRVPSAAILRFQSVPTDAAQLLAFDSQVRQVFALNSIAETVVSDIPEQADTICEMLEKPTWDATDRKNLLKVIQSLYKPYTS